MMQWKWRVSYKDFTGEWVDLEPTLDVFTAMTEYRYWIDEGHATKIVSSGYVGPRNLEPKVDEV